MSLTEIKRAKTFEGDTIFYSHKSYVTKTTMNFSVYRPKSSRIESAIIWLSGLTCNEENFITKAGAQRYLKDTNTMIICPDTSPRGLDLPGEHESYDFGSGAGFYLNATSENYKNNYQMYDYISKELVSILKNEFNITKLSLMGHSMGGHGALVIGLREQDLFKSISAFSPLVNPTACAWGKKAMSGYLNNDDDAKLYDATELVKSGYRRSDCILIDQGLDDEFLEKELLTENFKDACADNNQEVKICYREGYDHSYYYISSFIEEHINFHLKALK
jgi:S-formylglutathione hydrolase